MRWWIFGLLMLLGGLPGATEGAERRVALIIGNDAYVKINALHNAGNDARNMEQALKSAGFEATLRIDADIETEADLEAEAVDAGKVLHAMAEAHNRLNIVVLDACRDNPLPKGRSLSRGLARIDAPTGTFIAMPPAPARPVKDRSRGRKPHSRAIFFSTAR
jgi:uncharacterized caspase-like protein